MSSNAMLATGTLIAYGDTASPTGYTTVAEIKSITGPDISRNVIDVTTHNTEGGWEEALTGLLRSGEITFDVNFVFGETSHGDTSGLRYLLLNNLKRNWRITFPAAAGSPQPEWTFDAYVARFGVEMPVDDVLPGHITLKPTGAITFTEA